MLILRLPAHISANMSMSRKSFNVSTKGLFQSPELSLTDEDWLKEMTKRSEQRKLLWEKRFESYVSGQDDDDDDISCTFEELRNMDVKELSKFISPRKNTRKKLKKQKVEKVDAETQTPEWLSGKKPVTGQDGLDLIIEAIETTMGHSYKCCVLQYNKYYFLKYDGVASAYKIVCRLTKQLVKKWRLVTMEAVDLYIYYIYKPDEQVVKTIEGRLKSNINLLLDKAFQKATNRYIQAARAEYTRLLKFLTDEQIMQYYCYHHYCLSLNR